LEGAVGSGLSAAAGVVNVGSPSKDPSSLFGDSGVGGQSERDRRKRERECVCEREKRERECV
jgi:hypothetical protein